MGTNRDREKTTFGLSRAKIARIMQIGVEKGPLEHEPPAAEDAAELLYDQMIQPLVSDSDSDSESGAAEPGGRLVTPKAPLAVGAALRDRHTAASTLKRLKDLGRKLFQEGKTEPQREVGLTIYYGAIASALVFHNLRITRLSYSELRQSLENLTDRPWMPADLQSLFREAVRTCESSHRPGGQPNDE
jgi:hypothetical protein